MNYIVVGTGYTGRRVLSRLPAEHAIGISRTATSEVSHSIQTVDLDDSNPAPDDRAFVTATGCSLLYTVPPGPDSPADHRLARLLKLLKRGPKRIVYISTSGVYGHCSGELVNEDQVPNPSTGRAVSRLAAETVLRNWCCESGSELTILRTPAIYGPDRLGLDRLYAGDPVITESDANPGNRVHVDDLAGCCVAAMTTATPGIYNVSDGDFRSSTWFSLQVAKQAGIAPPPQVPFEEASQSLSETRLSFIRESRRLDNGKLLAEMGPAINYTNAEDGIRASLREMEKEAGSS